MAFALTWMPGVLEDAGLKVAEVDGWPGRGRAEMGRVLGVMVHHTATSRAGNMPTLATLRDGRTGLAGPLAQLGLGRDGTFYVVAAGRANHAGVGAWEDVTDGNAHFIGIEAENSGQEDALPWPVVQYEALRRGVAALLRHVGRTQEWCVGHKEYALPPGRKPDPLFDMALFRSEVGALLADPSPPSPVLIPVVELIPPAGGIARPTLRRGSSGEWVRHLQLALHITPADGRFGPLTEAAVRRWQRAQALVPDGIVGPKSWAVVGPTPLA